MAAGRTLGRVLVLLLLIIAIAAGGLVWFDYLNLIDIKTPLAPVYRLLGLSSRSQPAQEAGVPLSLDAERLAARLEYLELQRQEQDRHAADLDTRQAEIEQMAAELEDRQKGLDERERAMAQAEAENSAKDATVTQTAAWLNGMPPQDAVAIISEMDDQSALEVFRKLDEIAAASGSTSIVSYWLSLLPDRQRAAALLRKMAGT